MTSQTKLAALGFLVCLAAQATPVFSVSAGQCPTATPACSVTNGTVKADLFNPFLISPTNDVLGTYNNIFKLAFKSWNDSLAEGSKWTLATGSLSNNATLTVSLYRAYVEEGDGCGATCGGAEIRVLYTPGAGDPAAIVNAAAIGNLEAVWSQSIFTNKKRDPSLPGNPYLDNAPGTAGRQLNPPAYPFQYAGSRLYDMPSRDADAIWLGQGFITQANYTTRTLTVYDGIGWGFTVSAVPEPSTIVLIIFGMTAMLWWKRRQHA